MYTRTVIRTNLTVPQAVDRLSGVVGTSSGSDAPFVGTVHGNRFKFHRVISGTRGFEVIVSGRIVAAPRGAELQIVIRIAAPVVIFQCACLAATAAAIGIGHREALGFVVLALGALVVSVDLFIRERRRTLQLLGGVKWVDPVP